MLEALETQITILSNRAGQDPYKDALSAGYIKALRDVLDVDFIEETE